MIMPRRTLGQTMIEFALVFPFLILLIFGLFDLGRAVFFMATLNTAVREGTRFAIVQPDCDYKYDTVKCEGAYLDNYPLNCSIAESKANKSICNEITAKFFDVADLSSSIITINHTGTTDDPKVEIAISYQFEAITPGISLIIGNGGKIPLEAKSTMLLAPFAKPIF